MELGSSYGAMEAHDGLWESAAATAHSLPARLAVESCVHEARGLDVLPQTIARHAPLVLRLSPLNAWSASSSTPSLVARMERDPMSWQ